MHSDRMAVRRVKAVTDQIKREEAHTNGTAVVTNGKAK
jgi:hypothetical protein